MPVKIPQRLPAFSKLASENIFVMSDERAAHQDIRPLKIAILNLMPTKEVTETQLLRLIGNTSLQVEVVFLRTATYESKNVSEEHLQSFYRTFDDVKNMKFDGLIVTGAPVEKLDFSDVLYWNELSRIMKWANKNVYSSLYICWAAQAALYYNYNIAKYELDDKMFGIFLHKIKNPKNPLVRGFDDMFYAPHSRHTEVRASDIEKKDKLEILAESDEAGVYLACSKDLRQVFVTGHGEYDSETLHLEYMRDVNAGKKISIPKHYYVNDDEKNPPKMRWRAHANLLVTNWLNYCVYQQTPYNIDEIDF